jgi:hypothetical protein
MLILAILSANMASAFFLAVAIAHGFVAAMLLEQLVQEGGE